MKELERAVGNAAAVAGVAVRSDTGFAGETRRFLERSAPYASNFMGVEVEGLDPE